MPAESQLWPIKDFTIQIESPDSRNYHPSTLPKYGYPPPLPSLLPSPQPHHPPTAKTSEPATSRPRARNVSIVRHNQKSYLSMLSLVNTRMSPSSTCPLTIFFSPSRPALIVVSPALYFPLATASAV